MADSKERVNEPCKVIESKLTIKFGFLENFNLSDEHIVKRVDGLTCLLYVSAKCIWDSANGNNNSIRFCKHWLHHCPKICILSKNIREMHCEFPYTNTINNQLKLNFILENH